MELIKVARTPAILATPTTTVFEAVSRMTQENVGALVVVNHSDFPVGIFTERDCLNRVTHQRRNIDRTLVGEVMTAPVLTASPLMPIEEGLAVMIQHRFRHLPIIDQKNKIIGIVSLRYLLMRRIAEKQACIEALTSCAALASDPDLVALGT